MPTLGSFIRRRRSELGWTQEELADKVGGNVRQADISRLENDRVGLPRRERLEAIAHALDVPVGALLARSGWQGAEELDLENGTGLTAQVGQLLHEATRRDDVAEERREVIDEALPELVETVSQVHHLVHKAEELLEETQAKVDDLKGNA